MPIKVSPVKLILSICTELSKGFPGYSVVKNLPSDAGDIGDMGSILYQEDPLKEEMATHSSLLA